MNRWVQFCKFLNQNQKRMKAAFNAFEQNRYKDLKAENPTLKRSQLKDILWKEWQKSPENPMNQANS